MVLNEREQAFFDWMLSPESGYRAIDKTVKGYIRQLRKIVRVEGKTLDDEFQNDRLEDFLLRYTYREEHALRNAPNLTHMIMDPHLLVRNITRCHSRIKQYKEFCEYEVRLLQRG